MRALVLDAGPGDLERLAEQLASSSVPILVRTSAPLLPAVLRLLRPIDDVCLDTDPPELVAHRLEQLLRDSSQRDSLTGLLTKRALLDRMSRSGSLILLDLDRFKRLNDLHGHAAGDAVLRRVGALLAEHAPFEAVVARYGGEEFAMIVDLDEPRALEAADRIRKAIASERIPWGGEELAVTISAGIAAQTESREEAWRQADEALYAAKARGRDRVVHYDVLEREATDRNSSRQLEHFEDVTRVITERVVDSITYRGRRLFQEIRERADVDALTGLYSRRYLEERLPKEIESDSAITIALLDIDFFGSVNKTHGWPTGDKVLAQVADRIMRCIRTGDWVARYGGEEITIVMRQVGAAHAEGVLERIRRTIAEEPFYTTSGDAFTVTASIGAAERRASEPLPSLMERVSEQLLMAKSGGRNRVHVEN
jgi:diguanylate cyclase (GGDEF)-like protein